MEPIIVTAATEREISQLVRELKAQPVPDASPRKIWRGEIDGCPVYLALTGIGKVNAGSTATSLIEKYRPRLLVNTGCGGAYSQSGLQVGDLAVATAEIYGDEGVLTVDGWHSLELIGIPAVERKGNRYSNEFPLSLEASEKAFQLAISLGLSIRRGKFITLSTSSGTAARGAELYGRFGGICENMEGAAIAHVAMLYEVDCLEVRGISNMVEDRDLASWDIPLAVEMAQRFLHKFIKQLCTGPTL